MKKIILFLFLVGGMGQVSFAQTEAMEDLKDEINADFNIVYFQHVYGSYIRFIGSLVENQDIDIDPEAFRQVRKVIVFNISERDKNFKPDLLKNFRSGLEEEGIEMMMEVAQKGSAIELFTKEKNERVTNFVVLISRENFGTVTKKSALDKKSWELEDGDQEEANYESYYAIDVVCDLDLATLIKAFNSTDSNSLINNFDKLDILNFGDIINN